MNPLTKSSWYIVEAFGNLFSNNNKEETNTNEKNLPQSLQDTYDRIKNDCQNDYFISGKVDAGIYDIDCIFADPFVSFSGRDRFITNLENLAGGFITENYSTKLLNYETTSNDIVTTKLMVKLELNLPWKPILAWPWGVTYTIDPNTYLITKHEESWDIDPLEGVLQIFKKPKDMASDSIRRK
eukprot:CAMPEP_0194137754 /NCGR_PEP_ID=MMETSP0152-20130528/7597_1 /TAXON_ID=1049557 /ORGANISM="Thalassiothrix antarctica, Strain L6-D1" /LENGTH=182 /DNA_ID=CAMNT_0038834897 /DNA_START=205 /DNA_END=753 /DNA_ORIENTATION=-